MTHIREADRIQGEIARELRSAEAVQSADELEELTEVERISGLCTWVGVGATHTKKAAQAVILHIQDAWHRLDGPAREEVQEANGRTMVPIRGQG